MAPFCHHLDKSSDLVVAAFPDSGCVQGNWDQGIKRLLADPGITERLFQPIRQELSQMKLAGIFKSVDQIANDTVRLVTSRNAIKCRGVILAIRTRERGSHLTGIGSGTDLAKRRRNPDSRFQTIPAQQILIQTRAAGNAKRWVAEVNHCLIERVETCWHEGTVAKPATRAKGGSQSHRSR